MEHETQTHRHKTSINKNNKHRWDGNSWPKALEPQTIPPQAFHAETELTLDLFPIFQFLRISFRFSFWVDGFRDPLF